MEVEDGLARQLLPVDSIKIMGESIGVNNLNDDAAVKLSEDLEYRLKEMIQDALKFVRHSKRKRLISSDIDNALRAKNVEPLYGFDTDEYIPFRHTGGGGKDLFFPDEKEVSLLELVGSPLPRLPCDVSVRGHWLAVEGAQPVIPENPAPTTIDEQQSEATGFSLPTASASEPVSHTKKIKFDPKGKKRDGGSTEWSKLKPLHAHALSLEQQLYYKEIADACVGAGSESKWQEALSSLSTDPGIYQLLPQFTSFINEGIKVNISQRKLPVLKHLVKMVGALLENSSLSLEKYLHELVPSLVSCLVNKQLCMRPESEDHWTLRDSAGKILAKICKKYSNSVNNIQPRVTRVLSQTIKSSNDQGLAVHYGAMCGLIELGQDTMTSLVIPRLRQEGVLIRAALKQQGKIAEHVAANKLQLLLLKHCGTVLLSARLATDTLAQYQADYGSLGQALFNQVKTLRQNRVQPPVTARVAASSINKAPGMTLLKNKPPPLSLPASQVVTIMSRSNSSTQSPGVAAISTPALAAALQLVAQAAKSNPATPTVSAPSISAANILSAVISGSDGQTTLAEHLTTALSANSNSSPPTQSPKISRPGTPVTAPVQKPDASS